MGEISHGEYVALARFRYALRAFLRFSEDAARAEGLTPNQHQLLLAVRGWDGEGAPGVAEVAERLQLKPHSALELVRRAEEGGLVLTHADADDHRRQLVVVTALGARHLTRLSDLHRRELRRFRTEMADLLDELR